MVAQLFIICVCIVIAGWLWFFVVRPILEDYGVIRDEEPVKPSQVNPSPFVPAALPPIMSKEDAPSTGINSVIPVSVSVSGTDTAGFDVRAVPSDLTYEEVVTILAGQMTPDGKPKHSGKKIYSFVGGNYNEFSALMKRLRPKDGEPAEPPISETPVAGRPTSAQFTPR